MKVLVTGNRGYIGSVLCGELLKQGFKVIGLDANFYKGCNFFKIDYNIKEISSDIRNITKEDIDGVDAIVHLAALSNDPMGAINPKLTTGINYLASVNLAKLAKETGVQRFIFSSSCSIYGVSGDEAINEQGALKPLTEYAKSKVDSEKEIRKLADNTFSPVFLRNATVYGVSPMLRVDLVVNNLVGCAFATKKIKIMSDGTPWRPLIHIRDICKAFIAVLKAPKNSIHNQTFNVGQNTENYRIKDIAQSIKRIMPDCTIEYTGEHGVDSRTYRVDFTKINSFLSDYFKPDWNVEKGVVELIDAFKRYGFNQEYFLSDKFIRIKRIKKMLSQRKLDNDLFWQKKDKL